MKRTYKTVRCFEFFCLRKEFFEVPFSHKAKFNMFRVDFGQTYLQNKRPEVYAKTSNKKGRRIKTGELQAHEKDEK